jgi:putative transcriptional regulator
MLRIRFKELVAEKEFQENRRITLEEIAKVTGIHRTTLSKVSNHKGYNTTIDVLDKLCEYFNVQIGELAEYISSNSGGNTSE